MLALINYMTAPDYLWVKWPAFGVGIAILGMWIGWLSGYDAAENREPKTLAEMHKVSGILAAVALALMLLNLTVIPNVIFYHWSFIGIGLSLAILWLRWFTRRK